MKKRGAKTRAKRPAARPKRSGRKIRRVTPAAPPMRWNPDPDDVQRSVVKLVLSLIEFIRKLMERQAIRRLEAQTLSAEEIENVGLALMKLEETVRLIAKRFKLNGGHFVQDQYSFSGLRSWTKKTLSEARMLLCSRQHAPLGITHARDRLRYGASRGASVRRWRRRVTP